MERLPRRSSGLHHENLKNPDRSSARGKARDCSIAMSADLTAARRQIVEGRASAAALLEESIAAAEAPRSARAFITTSFDSARRAAAAADHAVAIGTDPGALAGLAVSVKDLFDVAGEVSAAASKILADAPPAAADAPATGRLRDAGGAF